MMRANKFDLFSALAPASPDVRIDRLGKVGVRPVPLAAAIPHPTLAAYAPRMLAHAVALRRLVETEPGTQPEIDDAVIGPEQEDPAHERDDDADDEEQQPPGRPPDDLQQDVEVVDRDDGRPTRLACLDEGLSRP